MAQKMLDSLKKISQLVSIPWNAETRRNVFTVIGSVEGVYEDAGWFYASCSQCSKNLEVVNGAFFCSICNGVVRYPMARFRVHLRVQDSSGETFLTMFNQQTEHLLDTSANKLMNRMGIESNEFPIEVGSLVGKYFVFSVKIADHRNPGFDYHHHRIVRLYEVEPLAQPIAPRKVKRKQSRSVPATAATDDVSSTPSQPCSSAESGCAPAGGGGNRNR